MQITLFWGHPVGIGMDCMVLISFLLDVGAALKSINQLFKVLTMPSSQYDVVKLLPLCQLFGLVVSVTN